MVPGYCIEALGLTTPSQTLILLLFGKLGGGQWTVVGPFHPALTLMNGPDEWSTPPYNTLLMEI